MDTNEEQILPQRPPREPRVGKDKNRNHNRRWTQIYADKNDRECTRIENRE